MFVILIYTQNEWWVEYLINKLIAQHLLIYYLKPSAGGLKPGWQLCFNQG